MFNPIATYRIQFHADFTFRDLKTIIPYLTSLGVKTIYASPIFEAVPGSMHGYDGINPHRINPEIGNLEELKEIAKLLRNEGMAWIQDIVPNHMGFHSRNAWLMDVLKNGERSAYRPYFDIISDDLEKEPLMLPFLGSTLEEVLTAGEIQLKKKGNTYKLKYHEHEWPLRSGTNVEAGIAEILSQQYYRPCCHKESNESINYRRFFTVNSLICLNIQDVAVFNDYHSLIKEMIDEGVFQGLRIDHVDGLYDPAAYLQNLRALCGPETYIVVEKILEPGELLPSDWPIQGTTGYDFLGLVNQLFTNEEAAHEFSRFYQKMHGQHAPVEQQIRKKKRDFLQAFMQGELDNLYQLFCRVNAERGGRNAAMDQGVFKTLISEVMVHCPVYRFYGNKFPLEKTETDAVEQIFQSLELGEEYEEELEQLKSVLLQGDVLFYQRLMQFTGPLMAKGVEDTLMYTYNRFIGNNEVGDSPGLFGISVSDFHQAIQRRQQDWPLSMNASATHDTKRAEDARARLNALTYLKDDWLATVKLWQQLNAVLKTAQMPDANDEYFIYQSLVASYPERTDELETFPDRLQEFLQKALRESKRNSEWENPDTEYEAATNRFIAGLLDPQGAFHPVFRNFQDKVNAAGDLVSRFSLILKMCTPGVPDIYQGTELPDFSMVDPDNRRPVNYLERLGYLEAKTNIPPKLELMQKLLQLRADHPELLTQGLYIPLELKGKHADRMIAFMRRKGGESLLVAVPLDPTLFPKDKPDWGDTRIIYQGEAQFLKKLSPDLPYLCRYSKEEVDVRGAGILLSVTSLPSAFGIGDFGPGASHFIDLLIDSGQKYWQLLPLNPIVESQSFSPYSSTSVMAGNISLISPELLCEYGLLSNSDLKPYRLKAGRKVDYQKAAQIKQKLLALAYLNYKNTDGHILTRAFEEFCATEKLWLKDYALYEVIKKEQGGSEWFKWPDAYKNRDSKVLAKFLKKNEKILEEIKWQQFIFYKQWHALKQKATGMGLRFIGDLPFYTALDSADVWANPQLFRISSQGTVLGVAGVPPDYFNEDGQLWGMPVYDWETMSEQGYKWWINRIAKNFEMFDLVRLDHFRAFSAYWEVPADSDTAKEGSWEPGPGADFFEALKKHFKTLPFIAEDLGEIDDEVYALRDQFELPGMRVLQFAFGEDMATSVHAVHNIKDSNSVVYTGTHDNNTLQGWYEDEIDLETKARISEYLGYKVNNHNLQSSMLRLAYASVAKIAVVPIQDLLSKGSKARMNVPASVEDNWTWRIKTNELNLLKKDKFKKMLKLYGR